MDMTKPLAFALLSAALLFGLAACDAFNLGSGPKVDLSAEQVTTRSMVVAGDTVSAAVVDRDTVIFEPIRAGTGLESIPPITAAASQNQIRVDGFFLAPCHRQPMNAEIEEEDGVIALRLHPKDLKVCADLPQPYRYTAYVTELASSSYTLKVVHEGDILRKEDRTVVLRERVNLEK